MAEPYENIKINEIYINGVKSEKCDRMLLILSAQ